MSANDESVSVETAFGGWPGMAAEEAETAPAEAEAAEVDAPTQGGDDLQQDEPESDDEGGEEPDLPEWKKYGFKDENAMWTSYKELQRTLTQQRSPQPEEVEEDDEEPEAPPTWQSHQFQALGEIPRVGLSAPQREQLADLMAVDPKAAGLWALQNQSYMDPQDYKAVQNNWAQADPYEYMEFRTALNQHLAAAEREEAEEGRNAYVLEQQRTLAINSAKEALPLMDERSDEFGEWLTKPENKDISIMLDNIQDPERLRNALVSAFYQYAGPSLYQELVQSHQQAAQAQAEAEAAAQAEQEAQQQRSRKGATQTRTAASSTPSSEGDADEQLRQAILNPRGL